METTKEKEALEARYNLHKKMNDERVMEILKSGRSAKRGEVTKADMQEVYKLCGDGKDPQAKAMLLGIALEDGDYDTIIFDSDLTIDGDLNLDDCGVCNLIVFGNLTVNGILEHYDDPATFIFVDKDLYAQNLFTGGALYVNGDVKVDYALVGDYNDYSAEITGNVSAFLFHPEEHFFTVGSSRFERFYGNEYRINDDLESMTEKEAFLMMNPELFSEPCMTDEEAREAEDDEDFFDYFDNKELMWAIKLGIPVFRNEPAYNASKSTK